MKAIPLIVLIVFSSLTSYSQKAKSPSVEIPLQSELVFRKTLDYAIQNDFFIANLDKAAGFIQITAISDRKKSLVSFGERITYNVFITKTEEYKSLLTLQIKVEEYIYKNYVGYYSDRGLTKDNTFYIPIIADLKSFMGK